ncbi:MAG: hypothetical protein WEA61_06460 [Anaerolineales bacterium]
MRRLYASLVHMDGQKVRWGQSLDLASRWYLDERELEETRNYILYNALKRYR